MWERKKEIVLTKKTKEIHIIYWNKIKIFGQAGKSKTPKLMENRGTFQLNMNVWGHNPKKVLDNFRASSSYDTCCKSLA